MIVSETALSLMGDFLFRVYLLSVIGGFLLGYIIGRIWGRIKHKPSKQDEANLKYTNHCLGDYD